MTMTAVLPPIAARDGARVLVADAPLRDRSVNLGHLERLSAAITLGDEAALLTHIYSEAPDYGWIDAPGEGIAALDDVARAALVYLDFWRATGAGQALERARAALASVLHLRTDEGTFHNFLLNYSGTPNRDGVTSVATLDWWSCRAFWALACGHVAFRDHDPAFAARLRAAYLATEALVARQMGVVGQFTVRHGIRFPAWLPADSPALAALVVLGLAEFQATEPNARTSRLLTALADGIAACQLGGPGAVPWGLLPHSLAAPLPWHAWGAHEAQALARAGRLLGRADWIATAAREVDGFFAWQAVGGQLHALDPLPRTWGQQVYGVNCQVQAALELFHATGEARYAEQAGLHGSWLFGNNAAGQPVYDPDSGRGYDGIDRRGEVNPHAGAESTIEALMAISALQAIPEAARLLQYRAATGDGWRAFDCHTSEAPADATAATGRWTCDAEGATWDCSFVLDRPGDYRLFAGVDPRIAGAAGSAATLTLDDGVAIGVKMPDAGWPHLFPLLPGSLTLAAGAHRWRVVVRGLAEPHQAPLRGLLLQPEVLTRRFVDPAGRVLLGALDLRGGGLRLSPG